MPSATPKLKRITSFSNDHTSLMVFEMNKTHEIQYQHEVGKGNLYYLLARRFDIYKYGSMTRPIT